MGTARLPKKNKQKKNPFWQQPSLVKHIRKYKAKFQEGEAAGEH